MIECINLSESDLTENKSRYTNLHIRPANHKSSKLTGVSQTSQISMSGKRSIQVWTFDQVRIGGIKPADIRSKDCSILKCYRTGRGDWVTLCVCVVGLWSKVGWHAGDVAGGRHGGGRDRGGHGTRAVI